MTRADLTLASDDSADDSFTSAPSSSFSSRCPAASSTQNQIRQ
jgi:hypothetical protein